MVSSNHARVLKLPYIGKRVSGEDEGSSGLSESQPKDAFCADKKHTFPEAPQRRIVPHFPWLKNANPLSNDSR